MTTINPYVNFRGNAEDAFNFYKSVFGGEFAMVQRFKDSPEAGRVKPQDQDKMMHIALPIGKDNVLMATDALDYMGHSYKEGNNFAISVSSDSQNEAEKIFNGLSSGGKVSVPFSKAFWGSYFGMLTDKFGMQWMVSHDPKRQ
jgi:PhnB protein